MNVSTTLVSMKLSEYAERKGIHYRTAWNRFNQGKIKGAYLDETGHIVVPDPEEELKQKAALYSRISTHGHRDDLERQEQRLKEFASSRGLEIVQSVTEIASGVSDQRPKLIKLLNTPTWGVLIVEHKDRLSRIDFGWFKHFLSLLGKDIIVVDSTADSDEGKDEDVFALLYSYTANEYGKRGAKHRAEQAQRALEGSDDL